ncbi:MAG: hypothetical protein M5R42_07740 [Rhodocyclaceae bacterium]|nr:hypothetical protein [Rhodocyclaceae bacterium]
MKFTSCPRRARPIANCMMPTRKVSERARPMYFAEPGSASCESVAKRTSEMALVGPDTRCQLEPKRAATTAGTMAA